MKCVVELSLYVLESCRPARDPTSTILMIFIFLLTKLIFVWPFTRRIINHEYPKRILEKGMILNYLHMDFLSWLKYFPNIIIWILFSVLKIKRGPVKVQPLKLFKVYWVNALFNFSFVTTKTLWPLIWYITSCRYP